jgi:hypothetical protein
MRFVTVSPSFTELRERLELLTSSPPGRQLVAEPSSLGLPSSQLHCSKEMTCGGICDAVGTDSDTALPIIALTAPSAARGPRASAELASLIACVLDDGE